MSQLPHKVLLGFVEFVLKPFFLYSAMPQLSHLEVDLAGRSVCEKRKKPKDKRIFAQTLQKRQHRRDEGRTPAKHDCSHRKRSRLPLVHLRTPEARED